MQPTLLIAEPSPPLQSALAQYFSTHGFDVRTADTAAALIGELQREGEETLQVFTAGRDDAINDALASYLDAEGVDFATLAEFQEFN